MHLFSREDFYEELRRRGCEDTSEMLDGLGSLWRNTDGLVFTVPEPEERNGRYPDWMLDDLIERLRLPAAPSEN